MTQNGPLSSGVVKAGAGTKWNILGHTYWYKANSDDAFVFETYDPPGTFVPPHIHPKQDEFIYVLEGTFDLYLDGSWTKASAGDLVCMPRGLPHAYYNKTDAPTRAMFWVTPGGKLNELFEKLHDLTDPEQVVRHSAACDVDFMPPGSVPGA